MFLFADKATLKLLSFIIRKVEVPIDPVEPSIITSLFIKYKLIKYL